MKARTDHRRLILVKHAEPVVDPDVPPNRWELSEGGKVQSEVLAERLRRYRPAAVVTSEEPKAAQTARVVAERLSVAAAAFPGSSTRRIHPISRCVSLQLVAA